MALKVTENRGSSLDYLTIEPDDHSAGKDYPLIFLLHGFGADMRDLAGLCENIHRRGYVYICPNAPLQFQIGPGRIGYGWTPPRDEVTQEDLQRATELLEGFFREIQERYQVASGHSLLLGFSQGGAMTSRCGLTKPDLFAGLVILSGALRYPEQLKPVFPIWLKQVMR